MVGTALLTAKIILQEEGLPLPQEETNGTLPGKVKGIDHAMEHWRGAFYNGRQKAGPRSVSNRGSDVGRQRKTSHGP